ncbi:putative phosphatidate phosphatase [Drosophila biarmipes]|uniref:putative phosphatidate phosphatase n=1 Tax=Drosophila biarmipes TaxID=125945 RepID=UPI0007E86434|nr:putative phosphatidate phosphatase [Drosophila biarmipes]XP_016959353.1 putative phosphatidate phosphatase [Drosophila biarmipes]XP_016959354.1 putative phosphatidate phosphatase [Drosophila biarmipes]
MRDATEDQPVALSMPASESASASAGGAASDRRQTRRLLVELLVVVILVIPICVYEFAVDPVRRGFFCDDESISYPFQDNTVTPVMLGLIVGLLPAVVFVGVEYVSHLRAGDISATVELLGWRVSTWYVELGRQSTYFCFGLLLTFDATEVGKYTIGRLRPHFLAVCQPQLSDGSMCSDPVNLHRYVENYECAGEGFTVEDVRQARLSFPSGHSSLVFYAMVYVALYLQRKITWRGSKLSRHFVQFALVMVAWYTALSRVMDHWHHWSDVLTGSVLGVAGALITACFIARMFDGGVDSILSRGLRRENTAATLQEDVCPTTPPPYSASSSFNGDQYCSKV